VGPRAGLDTEVRGKILSPDRINEQEYTTKERWHRINIDMIEQKTKFVAE
jgi:hypothetical protein